MSDPVGLLAERLGLVSNLREVEGLGVAAWLLAEQLVEARFCLDLAEILLTEQLTEKTTRLLGEIAQLRGDGVAAARYRRLSEEFAVNRAPATEEEERFAELVALAESGEWQKLSREEKLAKFHKAGFLKGGKSSSE